MEWSLADKRGTQCEQHRDAVGLAGAPGWEALRVVLSGSLCFGSSICQYLYPGG